MPGKIQPIVVASHPRSGTHIALDLFRKQFLECQSWKLPGEKLNRLYISIESLEATNRGRGVLSLRKANRILRRVERPLIKTHLSLLDDSELPIPQVVARQWLPGLLKQAKICYVIRDPRDTMCSYHIYRQRFDPRAKCSISSFLRIPIGQDANPLQGWRKHVQGYYKKPEVRIIRFERMMQETHEVIRELANDLSLTPKYEEPLLPRRLRNRAHSRINRLLSTRPESTAIDGRANNQKPEQWTRAFSRDDRLFVHEQIGPLLIDLGFEADSNWIDE